MNTKREIDDIELDKWFARRWLGLVVFSFTAGVITTLFVAGVALLACMAI
jgi:hypothetical protein